MAATRTRNLTPKQKLEFVRSELRRVLKGKSRVLRCPYCGGKNEKWTELQTTPPVWCCGHFAYAASSELMVLEANELMDHAKRIEDRSGGRVN